MRKKKVAKDDDGLKVHNRSKHTEQNKTKCWKCDFTCATKSDLTTHNDKYYYSHRMSMNSYHKRYILEEFEKIKNDGLTVKEDIIDEVTYWKD